MNMEFKYFPRSWAVAVAIFLAGLNMRPLITSVSALLLDLQAALGLSATIAGLLVALPTLYFGVFSITTPMLLRIMKPSAIIVASLLLLAIGTAMRVIMGTFGLFAGMLIASIGISFIAVLAPATAKKAFPHQIGPIMGIYSMSFCLGAALGAGITKPLAGLSGSDWHFALAVWALPAMLGAIWWSCIRTIPLSAPSEAADENTSPTALWHDPLAWQVTLFMGLQSCLGHSLIGWMPTILIDRGLSAIQAGAALSGTLLLQLTSNLITPWLAARLRDQRLLTCLIIALYFGGAMGLMYAPIATVWIWVAVCGVGMGGAFSMGLSLIVLRSRTPVQATALSSMAQGIGYIIAATGPFLMGLLYDYSNSWDSSAILLTIISLMAASTGIMAGRAKFVLT